MILDDRNKAKIYRKFLAFLPSLPEISQVRRVWFDACNAIITESEEFFVFIFKLYLPACRLPSGA